MTDENYEAHAQAHLASLKRDMRVSLEDAVVRAMHKVMAEFEAKSDERLMEDWGPGPHEVHSLPARGPEQKPVALPEKIYEFVPTPEPEKWHHPECEGECIACLIERVVQEAYGSQGLSYLQRHLTSPPAQQEPLTGGDERRHIICLCPDCIKTPQRKPLTHDQRVDLLAKFEAHKHEWHAPAILIDMVEAAHGIGEKK